MMSSLSDAEIIAIENNLFREARAIVRREPNYPWHRDRSGKVDSHLVHSSQSLSIDLFETVRGLSSRDAILDAWADALDIEHAGNTWESVDLEFTVPRTLLNETRPTQVDAVAKGSAVQMFFECKFTERDGGGCSQIQPLSRGQQTAIRQCNGNYETQLNLLNRVEARCALAGKGIRYWDFIPSVLDVSASVDHEPCPFRGGWYQWMRNVVSAFAHAKEKSGTAAFIIVYAAGSFSMADKIRSDDWRSFRSLVKENAVTVREASYQELLAIASNAVCVKDREALKALSEWIENKIRSASSRKLDT